MRVKELMIAAVLGGAIVTGVTGPAMAERGGNESLQFCRSIARHYSHPQQVIGPCTSYFQSHNSRAVATTAFACKHFFVPAGEFSSRGKCVSTLLHSL